ncbi:MAG: CHAT domain-containing protein [Chloroflexota bacterium]
MTVELILTVDSNNMVTAYVAGEDISLASQTPFAELPRIADDDKGREGNPFKSRPFEQGSKLFDALGGKQLVNRLEQDPDFTLLLKADEQAAQLPWEFATTPDQKFLVCNYIVLRLPPTKVRLALPAPDGSLNFIALAADPLVNQNEMPIIRRKLDIENELQAISIKLNESGADLHTQRIPPIQRKLQSAFKLKKPTILHISCHGKVIPSNQGDNKVVLHLEDDNGMVAPLDSKNLVSLPPRGVVRLVFLSACRSAASALGPSLAREIVRLGTPAAVGMQGNFPDHLSDELAATFYEFLLAEYGIGQAMLQARKALQDSPFAVGLPVLYVNSENEPISIIPQGKPRVQLMRPDDTDPIPLSLQPPDELFGRKLENFELARIFNGAGIFAKGSKVITITGPIGIGKSTLAAAFASRFSWRFNKVFGFSFQKVADINPVKFFSDLLRHINPHFSDEDLSLIPNDQLVEQLVIHILKEADGSNTLIILDDYEIVLQLIKNTHSQVSNNQVQLQVKKNRDNAEILHRYLYQLANKANKGLYLLITSNQYPVQFDNEHIFRDPELLEGLDNNEGENLFVRGVALGSKHSRDVSILAQEIAVATEGHPLALKLLAQRFNEWPSEVPISDFLSAWRSELSNAKHLGAEHKQSTICNAMQRMISALSAEQLKKLLLLNAIGGPFSSKSAAELWLQNGLLIDSADPPLDIQLVSTQLSELTRLNWLTKVAEPSPSDNAQLYQLNPVTSAYLSTVLMEV